MSRNQYTTDQWRLNNPDKILRYRAASNEKRRSEEYRLSYRLKKYGLTEDDYSDMIADCGYSCNLCGASFHDVRMVVDHDHDTGFVRGLLCDTCNIAIHWIETALSNGNLQDYIDWIT